MALEINDFYEFGPFQVSASEGVLRRDGGILLVTPKAFETLLVLVKEAGRVVEKEQLIRTVWPDTFVEEGNLSQNIFSLRRALGKTPEGEEYIQTVPKRGYRLTVAVREAVGPVEDQPLVTDNLAEPPSNPESSNPHSPSRSRERIPWFRLVFSSALAVGGIAIASILLFGNRTHPAPMSSVAVIPFLNLDPAPDTEYFSDGLTEEIISALASVPGLRVAARASAFRFKGKPVDMREIGRRLNVGAVLEGSATREGNRLRVTAQLNRVSDGYHYWARSWDRDVNDVFAVQEEIARKIVESLRHDPTFRFSPVRPATQNQEAYRLYLQGRFFQRRVFSSTNKAIDLFHQAIALDPGFALAYAGVAECYVYLGYSNQERPSVAYPQAESALRSALALEPSSALAHSMNGWVQAFYDWDWTAAEQEFRRAIEMNGAESEAPHSYAHFLVAMGRFKEAERQGRRAIELDPLDASKREHLGWHYMMSRELAKSVTECERALEIDPSSKGPLLYLQQAYEDEGRFEKAIDTVERRGDATELVAVLRQGLSSYGPRGYWQAQRDYDLKRARSKYIGVRRIAKAYARLGETDQALEWLRRGIEERDGFLVYLKVDPAYDGLREDPRFQELIKRVGLP